MKQRFKNKTYTTTKVVNNIIRIYNDSQNKNEDWYVEANEFAMRLSIKYQTSLSRVSGIIAALSPLKSWTENKIITETFLKTGVVKHTKLFKQKANAILNSDGEIDTISEILNGNKITSFFLNIYMPDGESAVTIDRHAVSIAVGQVLVGDSLQMSSKQYEFFVNCYRIAAIKLKELPSKVQAVTWVRWRELKNEDSIPF